MSSEPKPSEPKPANQAQIEFWNGARAQNWVAEQALRDRALAPYSDATLALALPSPGERVLDIGCGCGATSLALSDAVGPDGEVLGLDVSEAMLARARERAGERKNLRFVRADASTYDLAAHPPAELLFSRFGVMFFDDPLAAFANLVRGLTPNGRMAFVCWRPVAQNEWLSLPYKVATAVVPPAVPLDEDAPGPLAFGRPERVRPLLEAAGLSEITFTPFDHVMPLGDGSSLDAAAADAITFGPTARLLADASDEVRGRVIAGVRDALAPLSRGGEVALPAGAWLVTARKRGAFQP